MFEKLKEHNIVYKDKIKQCLPEYVEDMEIADLLR